MYRQAILDAKAVRASAIANAKASLQEAFEPKIQEMLRMKLSEELEEEIEEEIEEGYEETAKEEGYDMGQHDENVEEGEGHEMTEAELDEILAELEAMEEGEEGDHPMEEADEEVHESLNEAEEGEDEEGEEPAEDEPAMEDDEEMEVTIKFSDLKDVLAPFVSKPEGEEGMEGGDEGGADEDTLSLDEILAELEEADMEEGKKHDMEEAKEKHEEDDTMEESKGQVPGYGPVGGKGRTGYDGKVGGKGSTGYDAGSKKLHEANETIKILSEKLQEINLLNAKLLYMNKIFKSKNLNESEKIRVVKSFDKAVSVKEVKNVYEILSESLNGKNKKSINESRGFASKPAGMAPKTPIVDSDPTVDRWQQLVFGNK